LAIGLGVSTKWSAAFLIPILLILTLTLKELNLNQILKRAGQFIFLPMAIYLTSWIGWFVSDKGWARNSGSNPISSLWNYHFEMLNFHTNLVEKHSYSANPWSWLVLGRPTSFYYQSGDSCGAGKCAQEILAMGTPLLWWSAVIAVAITLGFYLKTVNKSAEIVLAGFAGTYLPWFFFQDRTMFYFYSITTLPFLILALIYCFDLLFISVLKYLIATGLIECGYRAGFKLYSFTAFASSLTSITVSWSKKSSSRPESALINSCSALH